jgi:hypothetical protein
MSLSFYRWFYRDVLRLSNKAALREALRRELERRMELKKSRAKARRRQEHTGLPEGHEVEASSVEADGDITVYPEVRRDVS